MRARTARRAVVVVCVAGIAGMIVASVAGSDGGALAFGLVTAAAVVSLMLLTAVLAGAGPSPEGSAAAEALAARVEAEVQGLVAAGADEGAIRRLVGDAVRLGRLRDGGRGSRPGEGR